MKIAIHTIQTSCVLCPCITRCLSCCTLSFGYCFVCCSSTYWFWLPLCYLQTLLVMLTLEAALHSFTDFHFGQV